MIVDGLTGASCLSARHLLVRSLIDVGAESAVSDQNVAEPPPLVDHRVGQFLADTESEQNTDRFAVLTGRVSRLVLARELDDPVVTFLTDQIPVLKRLRVLEHGLDLAS